MTNRICIQLNFVTKSLYVHNDFALYETCFMYFLNNVKIIVRFLIYKPGIKVLLYYVVGMFSKYLSSEQAIKDRKDCACLAYVKAPHPNFGLGAKSENLSSVASPRKKTSIAILRLVCIYSAWKTLFY